MSEKGAIVMRERCHATVSKRWAKEPRLCRHYSLRSIYCHQHMKQLRHFRIMKSNKHGGYGLFTTIDIPANKYICAYSGDRIITDENIKNPFMLQIIKDHLLILMHLELILNKKADGLKIHLVQTMRK